MKTTRLINVVSRITARLGVCGSAGVLVGAIVGMLLALLDLVHGTPPWRPGERLGIAAILAGFGWLVLLFVFVALVRNTLTSVAVPTLVNAVLVSFATTYLAAWLHIPGLAWALGIVVGALIGLALCWLRTILGRLVPRGLYRTAA